MIPPLPAPLSPAQQQRTEEILARAEKEALDLDDLAAEEKDDLVRLEILRTHAERNPETTWIIKQYGAFLGNREYHEEAYEAFSHCRALEPDNMHTFSSCMRALFFMKAYEQIISNVDNETHFESGEQRAELFYWKANALLGLKRYEEALELSTNTFYMDVRSSEINGTLAFAHYKLGHYEEAIHYYNEAIKLDPSRRVTYLNKACVYALTGKFQESFLCMMQLYDMDKKYFRKNLLGDEELQGLLSSEFGPELLRLAEKIEKTDTEA